MQKRLETLGENRDFWLAVAGFVLALVLWQVQGLYFLTYPLRLFVTMVHELGHGLSSILTGGEFLRFEVSERGAGLAYTRGGIRAVVIQAGYLGTAIFGAVLLVLTYRTGRPGRVAIGIGILLGALTLLFTGISVYQMNLFEGLLAGGLLLGGIWLFLTGEDDKWRYRGLAVLGAGLVVGLLFAGSGNLLTIVVGLAAATLLVLLGLFGSREVVVVLLTFLAFLTGLQAITDSWILLRIVSLPASMVPNNDASSMAREVGGTAALWAVVWIALDILIFGTAVYVTFLGGRKASARRDPVTRVRSR